MNFVGYSLLFVVIIISVISAVDKYSGGMSLFKASFGIFFKYPIFILPILCVWAMYAPTVLYFKYVLPYKHLGIGQSLLAVFLAITFFSFMIVLSSLYTLEFIQQIESDEQPSLLKATHEVFSKDLLKAAPLALLWAILWFLLTVADMLTRKKNQSGDDHEADAAHMAQTLAGYQSLSSLTAILEALKKGLRMVVFLILPGIAWEDLGFRKSMKKGILILKTHVWEFASGYSLTYMSSALIFLVPAIFFELGIGRRGRPPLIHFPEYVWTGVIVYIGFAWSFCIYLEQMFCASLYLSHLIWVSAINQAVSEGKPAPKFSEVCKQYGQGKILSEYFPRVEGSPRV